MKTIQEIKEAIETLTPDDLKRLSEWFRSFENSAFDRQIAADSASGSLEFLIEELNDDIALGRTKRCTKS